MTDVRRGLAALTVMAAISVALLAASMLSFGPLESLAVVASPVSRAVGASAAQVRSTFTQVFGASQLQRDNATLRAEVDRLTAENVRLRQLQLENDQLRQQLGFTSANPGLKTVNARVVGRDPSSLRQYLVVDRGSADGIQPGMAVVHPGGALIGQVVRVEDQRAEVLLITDIDSSVNARVERTRADGIVEGQWQEGSFLLMRYIEQGLTSDGQARIRKDDWIVTSGLGGRLPSGVLIGRVTSVKQLDSGLEQQAEVAPAVDVRSVQNVLVVVESQQ